MGARVLIIEDDDDARMFLAELLRGKGYEVEAVGSSAEARVASCKAAFDAALADFLVDTHDVATSWRQYDDLTEMLWPTPVLLVTGWRMGADELEEHGVTATLSKPFAGKRLFDWLEDAVATRTVTADERRLVREYFARLSARQWDAFAGLCTEDVTYRLPGEDTRFARAVTGRAELQAFTAKTFQDFESVEYEPYELIARPGYLTVQYRSTWTAGGAAFAGHGTVLLTLREGAIAGIAVRFDPSDVVEVGDSFAD